MISHKDYNISIWDYCVGIIFIFTSGTMIWFQFLTPKVAFTFYFIICLIYAFKKSPHKVVVHNSSFLYCCYIIFLSIVGTLLFYSPYVENTTPGYIISMLGTYFLFTHSDFYRFRYVITNIVYFITLIGIPIFILTELDLLPLSNITFNETTYKMFAGYSIGWPYLFHRFAGLWHEPGACQIFMNIILWLHIDNFLNWKWRKGELRKMIVILIGLFCTLSTGGFIVLMLLIFVVVLKLKIPRKFRVILKPTIFLLGIGLLLIIYKSNVIQEKLFADESGVESVSKLQRLNENVSMLTMTLEKPIVGWGLGSKDQVEEFVKRGNGGCSNGILYMSCAWGMVWAIPFFILVFRTIKRMNFPLSPIWLFIVFLLLESNERYLEYPISFLFLFPFKTYKNG